jgi:hypothetical protein
MNERNRFAPILEEIEFFIAERNQIASSGPHLIIQYKSDGEGKREIVSVRLVHRFRPFQIKLSRLGRIFVDFLAQRRHMWQTASEIEAGIDELYANDATHPHSKRRMPLIARRIVKVYVQRLRNTLGRTFEEAGLKADPYHILRTERSESNQVLYKLLCTAELREED